MKLLPLSFGIGDRFAQQGTHLLEAFQLAESHGHQVQPVWNKSHREHQTVGTQPAEVYAAAEQAVQTAGWQHPWAVDADHITLDTVDLFLDHANFFTLDVAKYIGLAAEGDTRQRHAAALAGLVGKHQLKEDTTLELTQADVQHYLDHFALACEAAGKLYAHIEAKKKGDFVAEVSMDEVPTSQTPKELLLILAGLALEGVQLSTIAPKFTGTFLKGVDYRGNVADFAREFQLDLLVLDYAVEKFGLPQVLKMSIHTGSDKFSLYPTIHQLCAKLDRGWHLKTAGTTWLEEAIGLTQAGDEPLAFIRDIYLEALGRFEELTAPYANVVYVEENQLPTADTVKKWGAAEWLAALSHNPSETRYNQEFRQFMHVSYKLAAQDLAGFRSMLQQHSSVVGPMVRDNIWKRHMMPLLGLNA